LTSLVTTTVVVVGFLATPLAGQARAAAPRWALDIHHNPTHLVPGGEGQLWFDLDNRGDVGTAGPITLQIELSGLRGSTASSLSGGPNWTCPGVSGGTTIDCTTTSTIPRRSRVPGPIIAVDAGPAPGEAMVEATIGGGGAAETASSSEPVDVDPSPVGFGLVPESVAGEFLTAGEERASEAGSHPFEAVFGFDLDSEAAPPPEEPGRVQPVESLRDFKAELPAGLVGSPGAVPGCAPAELFAAACPISSQVGRVDINTFSFGSAYEPQTFPVFNMEHPRGAVADLAFLRSGAPVHIKLSLDPSRHYAVTASASVVNETLRIYSMRLTLWGVPADPAHDLERCALFGTSTSCPSTAPQRPFLTLPPGCGGSDAVLFHEFDSWQHPGKFGPGITLQLPPWTGCEGLHFDPSISAREGSRASPGDSTELEVGLSLPQDPEAGARATSPIKEASIALPVQLSPAGAAGKAGCTPAEIGLGLNTEASCPSRSLLGTASVTTPLLPTPLTGSIYLAAPGDNPFGSRYAVYLAVSDSEGRGVLVKLAGRVEVDPQTGQVTARFDLPQLPFENLELHFAGGAGAPFAVPEPCGRPTVRAELSSWAQPDRPVERAAPLEIEGSCGPAGFRPSLRAGTVRPTAGASSAFVFELKAGADGEGIGRFSLRMPGGLSADLAAARLCGDATAPSGACPSASRIGYATAEVGSAAASLLVPNFGEPGSVYLGGPYRGAPYSLVASVPARAGPFDLGPVVVRSAIRIGRRDARIELDSGPLPERFEGIPIAYRAITVVLDRSGFIVNPSSCRAGRVVARVSSPGGATAEPASRFQVGGCASLGFRPQVGIRLSKGVARHGHPALSVELKARRGDANLRSATVALPREELLDSSRLDAVCTAPALTHRSCPRRSRKGWARAWSPLLPAPVEGPVVLTESGRRFPDLVADLHGPLPLQVVAHLTASGGRIHAVADLPDVPLTRVQIDLAGGKAGVFVNSEGLCEGTRRTPVVLVAHNGRRRRLAPMATMPCPRT
jgi:hypothetical protein